MTAEQKSIVLNPQQQLAVDLRQRNILVSASAGTGKTSVLTQRVLKLLINDNEDIARMLILTFTKAAAAEMRQRIAESLAALAADESLAAKDREQISRQLMQLPRAKISTFHSFCGDILRSEFSWVGCDPLFRVGDANEIKVLEEAAMELCLETMFAEKSPAFRKLAFIFGSYKSTRGLRSFLLEVYDFARSQPDPFKWLEEIVGAYELPQGLAASPWGQNWLNMWNKKLMEAAYELQQMVAIAQSTEIGPSRQAALRHDLTCVEILQESISQGFAPFTQKLIAFAAGDGFFDLRSLKKKENIWDDSFKERFKALRDALKGEIKKDAALFSAESIKKSEGSLKKLLPMLQALVAGVRCYHQCFSGLKEERNILDFNDLEHLALAALRQPEVQEKLRRQCNYILIDECQDTNGVQEALIDSICRKDNVFRVGDVKQSIYRFRMADPTLFLEHCRQSLSNPSADHVRIDLQENHRSRPQILKGINQVFRALMQQGRFETDYLPEAELLSPAGSGEDILWDRCQLLIADKPGGKEEEEENEQEALPDSDAEAEAHLAARWLLSVREQEGRPWRDFAVLLRSTPKWGEAFLRIFRDYGIPVFSDDEKGFFQSIEILMLLDYLRVLDNFAQDLPLLAALRSPFGGFSLDELAHIRIEQPADYFYQSFTNYFESEPGAKGKDFVLAMQKHKKWLKALPADQAIWQIILQSGYLHFVAAMPNGQQRQGNLVLFIQQVKSLADIGRSSLSDILEHLDNLNVVGGDAGTASLLGEGEDLVRIMTVHKSKGLEFPVVIIPRAAGRFNFSDKNKEVLLHHRLGIGMRIYNIKKRSKRNTFPRQIIMRQIQSETQAEQMRLLYVALTRAKERLLVIGTADLSKKLTNLWMQPVFAATRANNWLDWMMLAVSGESCEDLAAAATQQQDNPNRIIVRDNWQLKIALPAGGYSPIVKGEDAVDKTSDDTEHFILPPAMLWEYPFANEALLPSKLAVTALQQWTDQKKNPHQHLAKAAIEGFLSGQEVNKAIIKGNAVHHFMQFADLAAIYTEATLDLMIKQLYEKGFLSVEEYQQLNPEMLWTFFSSPLAGRLRSAKSIHREVPFVIRRLALMEPGDESKDDLLIQGKIDLYFVDIDGNAVVIDFKTGNNRREESREHFVQQYAFQVRTYCRALEVLKKIKVSEAYLFHFGELAAVPVSYQSCLG